jgi:hypothetical protein
VIKLRWRRWDEHVLGMGGMINTYKILVGKPEEKRPLEMTRRRWEITLNKI